MAIIKTTDKDRLDFDAAVSELSEYFASLGARKGRALTPAGIGRYSSLECLCRVWKFCGCFSVPCLRKIK